MVRQYLVATLLSVLAQALPAQTTVTYSPSPLDFANPERGFYRYSETRSSNYTPLVLSELQAYRQLNTPPSAGYQVYSTLVYRYFFLESFKASDLSAAYLAAVQNDFNVAREAGVKLIPRFAYTDEITTGACGSFICPPYGDAAKVWVLRHILQLTPVLQANTDVTAAVQMGFIGTFGENYYTDFFGDASQGPDFKLTDANWQDRNDVLAALLDAVPTSRMVQVRYPQLKQRLVYGIQAPTTSAALAAADAYNGTRIARVGFHNDCLLASPDDFGTFTDYGNSTSPSQSDTTNLKPYADAEGEFVAVGGETCTDAYSPQNDCAGTDPIARADAELRRLGYSYLNSQFNNDVNDDWVTGGCMDAIKRELGYRFELQSGTYTSTVAPGQVLNLALSLRNVGYATPFNARAVQLVLRNNADGQVYRVPVATDPRRWTANGATTNLAESFCVPASVPVGDYALLLNLPDPMVSIAARPEYAIRVANLLPGGGDVWQSATGFNDLGHVVSVATSGAQAACGTEAAFAKTGVALPVTLVNFAARPAVRYIDLDWVTASERDNAGFYVERSLDGLSYETVRFVSARHGASGGATYTVRDAGLQPATTYYYRLLQRDGDGTASYSSVVAAKTGAAATPISVQVYPNPVGDYLRVDCAPGVAELSVYTLHDALGQQVDAGPVADRIDVANLPAGVYFLTVETSGERTVRRIVKG